MNYAPAQTNTSCSHAARILLISSHSPDPAIRQALDSSDFRVKGPLSSAAALDHYSLHAPQIDLVLVDDVESDVDIALLAKQIHAINPRGRLIVCTHNATANVARALEAGALGLLVKPLYLPQVTRLLHAVLEREPHSARRSCAA